MSAPCSNAEWAAANPGYSIEWARGMWWCDCEDCSPVSIGCGFK